MFVCGPVPLWCARTRLCRCATLVCFVKQKTAYEMRISDWSSDVCSADLEGRGIYENIQKFIRFLLSTNVALVILVLGGAILAYTQNQIGSASCRERVCQYV